MSVRHDSSQIFWTITTRSSVISCEASGLLNGGCELRVYQGGELAVREVFQSMENAERYAKALRDKLLPLAVGESARDRRAS